MTMKVVDEKITKLEPNQIFVFGSNLSGYHGAGAAKTARKKYGAVWGQAYGLQGQSFAIPTVKEFISGKMELQDIKKYVNKFLELSKLYQEYEFLVTEIGCGLAGYNIEDIAPMFKVVLEEPDLYKNIILPKRFVDYLQGDQS